MNDRKKLFRLNFSFEKKYKKELLLLFLSLLAHLILIVVFFTFGFHKKFFKVVVPQKISKDKSELPASLKPRKSKFGSYVFFDDTPHEKIPKTMPEELPGKDVVSVAGIEEAKITEVASDIKPEQEVKKIAKPSSFTEKHESLLEKRIREMEENQTKIGELSRKGVEFAKDETTDLLKSEKEKTVQAKSKKRNILAMTKGYLESLKDEGNDALERKGDDKRRPSFEELKYISYIERIGWALQSSFKRNFSDVRISENDSVGDTVVYFTIDENGNLVNSELVQSSGLKVWDNMILKNFKFASPFPPVPRHFGTKTFSTRLRFYRSKFWF